MFKRLYDWAMDLSRRQHAQRYLFGFSFAESIFFPVPTDVMLAPMVMAQRELWIRLATIATVASVLGALVGYPIGYFFIETVLPWITEVGYLHNYEKAQAFFLEHGFWALLIAGFTPIPFKVFTIAGGAAAMPLLPFVLASLVGRGMRFFLVAGLVALLGPAFETKALKYIDAIGWGMLVLIVIGVMVWKLT